MICPKCNQSEMIFLEAGHYTFRHSHGVSSSSWPACYYCSWCNKVFPVTVFNEQQTLEVFL